MNKVGQAVARKATGQSEDDSRVDTAVSCVNRAEHCTRGDSSDQHCYEHMPHDCMAIIISMVYHTVRATMGWLHGGAVGRG